MSFWDLEIVRIVAVVIGVIWLIAIPLIIRRNKAIRNEGKKWWRGMLGGGRSNSGDDDE